jgi:redox-regulated HSP33 family molecular chaperone
MAAAVLLGSSLKFEGKLVLQGRSEAQIPLIMVDCEFCNQQYRFTREDLAGILGDPESKTLH